MFKKCSRYEAVAKMSDAEKDYSIPTGILQLIAAQTMSEVASRDPRYQSIANMLMQSIDIMELLNVPSTQRQRPEMNVMLLFVRQHSSSTSKY